MSDYQPVPPDSLDPTPRALAEVISRSEDPTAPPGNADPPIIGKDVRGREMRLLPIESIRVGERFRKELGNIDDLLESIQQFGQLKPILITPARELIDGARILEALRRLGKPFVMAIMIDVPDPRQVEIDANVVRRPYLLSEAVAIAKYLIPLERERSMARMRSGKPCEEFAQGQSSKTMERVAKWVGMSRVTLEKAIKIVEAARSNPELQDLVDEMDKTGMVEGPYRKLQERKGRQATDHASSLECTRAAPPREGAVKVAREPRGKFSPQEPGDVGETIQASFDNVLEILRNAAKSHVGLAPQEDASLRNRFTRFQREFLHRLDAWSRREVPPVETLKVARKPLSSNAKGGR